MIVRSISARRRRFVLAAVTFCLLRQGAFAQDSCCDGSGCCGGPPEQACTLTYGARGVVRDRVTGDPIADATIAVLDLSGASAADGSFEVSGTRPETCHLDYYFLLIVSAPGYEPYTSTLYTSATFPEVTVELDPTDTPQVTVSGLVAELPMCGGAMRGATVILEPLNLITRTSGDALDGGRFAFHDVPPGHYTIRVLSGCIPGGCWEVKRVRVDSSDVAVRICLTSVEPELPTPTATPDLGETPPRQPGDADTSSSPNSGGGCSLTVHDRPATIWSWSLLLAAAIAWRLRARTSP